MSTKKPPVDPHAVALNKLALSIIRPFEDDPGFYDFNPLLQYPDIVVNFSSSLAGLAKGIVVCPDTFPFRVPFCVFGLPVVIARSNPSSVPPAYALRFGSFVIDLRDIMAATKRVSKDNGLFPVTYVDTVLRTGTTTLFLYDALPHQFILEERLYLAHVSSYEPSFSFNSILSL